MIRRPPRSTLDRSSAASDVYKRQGIIHFSYGHFYQLPPFSYLYTNPTFENNVAVPTFGNANLNPEKTVTYEIGLQQQMTEDLACLLYTSPSPRDRTRSRMTSSA